VLQANRLEIEANLGDSDVVLDIGGWARPWARADFVVDALPYETRGVDGADGAGAERFTAASWMIADVNKPLPFSDKQFDYVTCSHVLEDIRDPLRLCEEMQRVSKAGYLETPSRTMETIYELEGRGYAGYCHHRWFVEVDENHISFRPKTDLLHGSRRFRLPRTAERSLTPSDRVTWLFWNETFTFEEVFMISGRDMERDLMQFRSHFPLPNRLLVAAEDPRQAVTNAIRRRPFLRRLASAALRRELQDLPFDKWGVEGPRAL